MIYLYPEHGHERLAIDSEELVQTNRVAPQTTDV
jgi:hypothetical protein